MHPQFKSYDQVLLYGQTALKKHRIGLLRGELVDSETGLDTSCSGEALDLIESINRYVFTTGSTNTFCVDSTFEEPMWLAAWVPLSMAYNIADHIQIQKCHAGCIVQHLQSKKVLINTMDLSLHRWWSADSINAMETQERAFLQQCTQNLVHMAQELFAASDPVVGIWIEYDDETTRTLYHFIIDYLTNCH